MNETLGRLHFWLTLIGVYAIFVPFHVLGIVGHPRRYPDTLKYDFLRTLDPLQVFITVAALITAAAQLIFLANLCWSLLRGARAPENPWQATTLEWTETASLVYRGPYQYSAPQAAKDFMMQGEP
jgi:cytochrome c oxidase subunit 1